LTALISSVAALNLVFLAVGYCVLAAPLAGSQALVRASYAGVALLVGAGLTGTAVFLAVIFGARSSLTTLAVAAAVVAAAGLALPRRRLRLPALTRQDDGGQGQLVAATALAAAAAAVAAVGLVGGFRSSPWLDDAWGLWLAKGVALTELGLDQRLFTPNPRYVHFDVLDYPLWWSVVTGLDIELRDSIDVRAVNAQLGILVVAFLGAVARLLSDFVRPLVLTAGIALIAFSPDLWRHAQGGVADLPLAIYLALYALALAGWIGGGGGASLLLAFAAGATALQVKTEALPELLLIAIVAAVVARRSRPLLGVVAVTGAAVATTLPWLIWRTLENVPGRVALGDALDPAYLANRAGRVGPSLEELALNALDPTSWLLLVPLLLATGAALAFGGLTRWLGPSAAVVLLYLFLVWAYWSNPDEIGFLLATSAYRTVDPLVLVAAVFLPVQAELLLRRRS
jgi:hypothetical protein